MFLRHPSLALDVTFEVKFADRGSTDTEKYEDKLRSHRKWAYKITDQTNQNGIKRHKRRFLQMFQIGTRGFCSHNAKGF